MNRNKNNKPIKMNKTDLVNSIAKETGLTKAKSSEVIDVLVTSITEALKSGEKVSLVGFGTFATSERSARKGRNPKSGAEIDIPAKVVAKFKAGATLVKNVN